MPRQAHHLADSQPVCQLRSECRVGQFLELESATGLHYKRTNKCGLRTVYLDFARAIDAARTFLRAAVVASSDGQDMVILDLDDTMLSSLPLLRRHHFGADLFNLDVWDSYVELATMPPLEPMLSLYQELRTSTACNCKNLNNVGYEDYILNLRSEPVSVVEFKTNARLELENKGFRIRAGIGEQWSDLAGEATGKRVFKLPNSLYYTGP